MQKKFWEDMVQLRFELYYLEEHIGQSYRYDNCINIFTAIVSSSSIAAWALWNTLKYLWSVAIALSQVISAVKIYLPYSKRSKFLNEFHSELSDLFNEYDYLWYKVSNGYMTEEEINEAIRTMRSKKNKITKKYLLNNHLPQNKKLVDNANTNLELYFAKFY